MAEEKEFSTTIELLKNYEFRVKFDLEDAAQMIMDELPPLGGGAGPDAARVLSAAVGNCLSASLLFCLQKSRVEVKSLKTRVSATIARNEEGYWRIKGIKVRIFPKLDPSSKGKMDRCLELFERYCIVTQSIRRGIDVQVEVI